MLEAYSRIRVYGKNAFENFCRALLVYNSNARFNS